MPLQVLSNCRRLLVTNADPRVFAPHAREILGRLGYRILTADELEARSAEDPESDWKPELLIADERRLDEVLAAKGPWSELPIVVLTGRRGVEQGPSQIVAAVKRPAGLHDLYRVLQQYFEEVPRGAPRVSTHLRVQCRRRGREWAAAVLSLSENGCLLRTSESVPLGTTLDLTLQLPRVGVLRLEAETAYQLMPDLGLVFNAIPAHIRQAIGSYVVEALAPA